MPRVSFHIASLLISLMCTGALNRIAAGDVVISMPPPPKTNVVDSVPATATAPSTGKQTALPATTQAARPRIDAVQDVGDIALARFTSSRTRPYDEYGLESVYVRRRTHYGWHIGFPFFFHSGHHHFGFAGSHHH